MDNLENYVHALKYPSLNRFYDRIVAATSGEKAFKTALLKGIDTNCATALDLACGTGTLALAIKASHPTLTVTGVDGDLDMLARARQKVESVSEEVSLTHAMAQTLPFEDNSFDLVTSTLFFHHLTDADKARVLSEVLRVLRPNGQLLIADWGRPRRLLSRVAFYMVQLLDGFETTQANAEGKLPSLVEQAGFKPVSLVQKITVPLGAVDLIDARKPQI